MDNQESVGFQIGVGYVTGGAPKMGSRNDIMDILDVYKFLGSVQTGLKLCFYTSLLAFR